MKTVCSKFCSRPIRLGPLRRRSPDLDARYKNKALIGTIVGISLFAGGWALMSMHDRGSSHTHTHASASELIAIVMMLVSIPLYLWGCAALAKAKGYSTAMLLTCVLGGLFPLVALLA